MPRYCRSRFGVLALLLPGLLRAQGGLPGPLDSGSLVRLHLTADTIQGRLVAQGPQGASSVRYCLYPGPPCGSTLDSRIRATPVAQIIHLDVAAGSRWKRGTVLGGLIGAAVGGFFWAVGSELCDGGTCRQSLPRSAAVSLGLGLGLGFAFGSASVRWRPAW
jgi:hypothetical protein